MYGKIWNYDKTACVFRCHLNSQFVQQSCAAAADDDDDNENDMRKV
jgi:hypothetical protein